VSDGEGEKKKKKKKKKKKTFSVFFFFFFFHHPLKNHPKTHPNRPARLKKKKPTEPKPINTIPDPTKRIETTDMRHTHQC
jgi:hypothetical protein